MNEQEKALLDWLDDHGGTWQPTLANMPELCTYLGIRSEHFVQLKSSVIEKGWVRQGKTDLDQPLLEITDAGRIDLKAATDATRPKQKKLGCLPVLLLLLIGSALGQFAQLLTR